MQELENDDVVYLTEDMEAPQQERILGRSTMWTGPRSRPRSVRRGSAGRLMQRELVVAPEHWTVGDEINFMRAEEWLPESFYDMIVVSPQMHPIRDGGAREGDGGGAGGPGE